MKTIKTLITLLLLIAPNLLIGQLTYTTQITNNTSCECVYNGPTILINQLGIHPTIGDRSIVGTNSVTASSPTQGEWIELYNPNPCDAIDISNYVLGNVPYSVNGPNSILIPSGSVIPSLGFAIVRGVNAPAPPAGVTDIVISSTSNTCTTYANEDFELANDAFWVGIYTSNGVLLDGIKYRSDPAWYQGFSMVYYPCTPPNSLLPANFSSTSMYQIGQMYPVTQYLDIFAPYPPIGSTLVRIPDGGAWSTSFQNENVSYGTCNVPGSCAQPILNCNGSATVSMTSGAIPLTYSWNTTPVQNTATATNLCAGNYCVTVTDAVGNNEVICVDIIDQLFNINATVVHTNCNQNNGSISLSPEGNGPFTYTWTPSVSTTNTANLLSSGTYSIHVNNGSCNRDTTIILAPSIGVSMTIDFSEISCITNQGTAEIIPNGGITPYTYSWSNSETTALITVTQGVQYIGSVTDSNGCTVSDTVNPVSPIIPFTSANYNSPICEGGVLNLTASTSSVIGVTYSWSGPNDFNSTIQNPSIGNISVSNSGNYIVTVSKNNCFSTDTATVVINPLPIANFQIDNSKGCVPLTVNFTDISSPSSSSLVWSFGDGVSSLTSNNVSHNYTSVGDFDVTLIVSSNGCSDTIQKDSLIHVSPYANASFSVNQTVASVDTPNFMFTNQSTIATIYTWDFGDNTIDNSISPSHTYQSIPFVYDIFLIANNIYNCPDTAKTTIEVIEPLIFYIPNTFTPDGDKYNEVFQPIFTTGFDPNSYDLSIYNRWGEIVFVTKDVKAGWDGVYDGEMSQNGTYTWAIVFKDAMSDKKYSYKGHVNLIK